MGRCGSRAADGRHCGHAPFASHAGHPDGGRATAAQNALRHADVSTCGLYSPLTADQMAMKLSVNVSSSTLKSDS